MRFCSKNVLYDIIQLYSICIDNHIYTCTDIHVMVSSSWWCILVGWCLLTWFLFTVRPFPTRMAQQHSSDRWLWRSPFRRSTREGALNICHWEKKYMCRGRLCWILGATFRTICKLVLISTYLYIHILTCKLFKIEIYWSLPFLPSPVSTKLNEQTLQIYSRKFVAARANHFRQGFGSEAVPPKKKVHFGYERLHLQSHSVTAFFQLEANPAWHLWCVHRASIAWWSNLWSSPYGQDMGGALSTSIVPLPSFWNPDWSAGQCLLS